MILILLIHLALAKANKLPVIAEQPPVVIEVPSGDKRPSIIYSPIIAYESEMSFIKQGEVEANAVLKSDCFKDQVLKTKFTENKGLTNQQIYNKFVAASPYKVGIKMFMGGFKENKIWHTVGYEGNPIRMNRYFVSTSTYVASTSLHEAFGHGLGFSHYTPKMNPNSIPYRLNAIYEVCAKQLGFKIRY